MRPATYSLTLWQHLQDIGLVQSMGWRRWDFSAWVVAAQYGPGTGLHRQQIFNTIRLYTKVDTTGFNRTMYVIGRLLESEFYLFLVTSVR